MNFIFFNIIIIIILIILIIYYYSIYLHIYFYNSFELSKFLQSDSDKFYSNLSLHNLKIRNINNIYYYLNNIENHLYSLNNKEKKIIKKEIYKAHNYLKQVKFPGFYYNKIFNLPWLIGCSKNNNYEFGYPHTRDTFIILNIKNIYDKNLYKTLIHERIHIYQKLFPNDINEFLKFYQFNKVRKQNEYDRANPDTDNFIYKHNNIIFECKINTKKNNIIEYTNNSYYLEHPYEYMAYLIEDMCHI
jgi:hypothetical protein